MPEEFVIRQVRRMQKKLLGVSQMNLLPHFDSWLAIDGMVTYLDTETNYLFSMSDIVHEHC